MFDEERVFPENDLKSEKQEEPGVQKALAEMNDERTEVVEKKVAAGHIIGEWSFKRLVALVMVAVLVGGGALGFGIGAGMRYFSTLQYKNVFYLDSKGTPRTTAVSYTGGNMSIADIVDRVGSSVVPVTSKLTEQDMFLNQYQAEGLGSGVIFNITGDSVLILTNNHVVDGANEMLVGLSDKLSVKATLVGVDPDTDLAVVKIAKSQIPADVLATIRPAVFGDSDKLRVGEPAIAIGNPVGFKHTVTAGIVSGLERDVDVSINHLKMIQTDASISPGNSGGALINSSGEVIGIVSSKIAEANVEGIGFAIPINSAKPIIDQLLTSGHVARPYLGISGKDIDSDMSQLYEIPVGVIVMGVVQGGPADSVGMKKGDVIIGFEGQKITQMDQLVSLIAKHKVGDTVAIKVVRDGKTKLEFKVSLKDKNEKTQ